MAGDNPVLELLCGVLIGTVLTTTACLLLRPQFTPRQSSDKLVRDFQHILRVQSLADPVKTAYLRQNLGRMPKLLTRSLSKRIETIERHHFSKASPA